MGTILIVDDHPASLMVLASVLASARHRVVEARDGVEAIAKVRNEHFDLVICDPILPDKSGYEFIQQLRNDPALSYTPVVFWVVENCLPEAQRLARNRGVNHVISKRSKPAKILGTVVAALGGSSTGHVDESEFEHNYVNLITERLLEALSNRGIPEVQESISSDTATVPRQARPILVVEDNPMDIDFMLQAFVESNVANPVNVCRDGEEALQYIEAHSSPADPNLPLLVLLDLRLPKVDGIDVLRQARKHPVWRQIPFVVVTTSRENADISMAYDLSVNSYIVKPVSFSAFAEVVKHIKVYWLLTNEPPFPDPLRRPS